jgi:hypothetical protein
MVSSRRAHRRPSGDEGAARRLRSLVATPRRRLRPRNGAVRRDRRKTRRRFVRRRAIFAPAGLSWPPFEPSTARTVVCGGFICPISRASYAALVESASCAPRHLYPEATRPAFALALDILVRRACCLSVAAANDALAYLAQAGSMARRSSCLARQPTGRARPHQSSENRGLATNVGERHPRCPATAPNRRASLVGV